MLPVVEVFHEIDKKQQELSDNKEMVSDPEEDPEMKDLAKKEVYRLKDEIESLSEKAKVLLLPKNPDDEKNTIIEIRAGTGGNEAALFVADLYKMYMKFAELNQWKTDIMHVSPTEIGGYKEIAVSVEGKNVYSRLKFEAGTHRVQRVPQTENDRNLVF